MSSLTYVVTSEEARVIDGLGVFLAGETKEFDQGANERFRIVRGVNLLPANLPEGVELHINTSEEGN